MARCTNCNYKWKLKGIWSIGFSKNGKKCPNCNKRQFISFKNENPLIGLGYLNGIIALFIIIFCPFFVKLTENKDETI